MATATATPNAGNWQARLQVVVAIRSYRLQLIQGTVMAAVGQTELPFKCAWPESPATCLSSLFRRAPSAERPKPVDGDDDDDHDEIATNQK